MSKAFTYTKHILIGMNNGSLLHVFDYEINLT